MSNKKSTPIVLTEEDLRVRARKLWKSDHNQQAWVRSVMWLGERWLLHPSNPPAKWGTGRNK
jgi:hypothetical protein